MDEAAERELIAGLRARDPEAAGRVYDAHAPAMLGLAVRILVDSGEAEDLVHDVFVEAWRKARSFSPERGSLRTWLLVRLRSRAIDRLRSRDAARRLVQREAAARSAEGTAPACVDPAAALDHARARAEVERLPAAQRQVLELAYFEGLSCSEIAARSGAPLGTVKSRMHAAMRALRRTLNGRGEVA